MICLVKIDLSRLITELEKEGSCKLEQLPQGKELLIPEPEARCISKVLRILSDRNRLRILLLLIRTCRIRKNSQVQTI